MAMARALLKELEPFCFYKIYLVIIGRFDILSIKRGDAKNEIKSCCTLGDIPAYS